MNYTGAIILFAFFLVAIPLRLLGVGAIRCKSDDEIVRNLNDQLFKLSSKPNRWGYTVSIAPCMQEVGLTYRIDLSIDLTNIKSADIAEIQRLYVDIYSDLIRDLNSLRVLRPFLADFPLTPTSCHLFINFESGTEASLLPPPYIVAIGLRNWKLGSSEDKLAFFQSAELKKGKADLPAKVIEEKTAHEISGIKEFYCSQAVRGASKEKVSLPIYLRISSRDSSPSGRAMYEFTTVFSRENNLNLVILGCVGEHYLDSRAFNFALRGSQCLNLEEARRLAGKCSKELFDFVCKDDRCLEYVKKRSTWPHEKYPSPTPIPEQLAFRISFWDENVDRPLAPYMAQIWLLDGKVRYYTADENQRLVLVHEETFDNAVSSLSLSAGHRQ